MATKSKKKALGDVTIVRRESDDEADKSGVATWALSAGEARGTIMRALGDSLCSEARVREATKMYAQSQLALDGALSRHVQADAMLRKSLDILNWAERYEFGAAMRTADARRKEEMKQ